MEAFLKKILSTLGLHTEDIRLVLGTNDDDELLGDDALDILVGLGGDDQLVGGNHFDIMLAGPGDDVLVGGSGGDLKAGGAGSDIYASSCYWCPVELDAIQDGDTWVDVRPQDVIFDPGNPDDTDELKLFEFDEDFVRFTFAAGLEAVRFDFDEDGAYNDLGIFGDALEADIISVDQFKGDGSGLERVRIGNGPGPEDDLLLMIQQGTEGTYQSDALVGVDQVSGREYMTGEDGEDFLFGNGGRDVLQGGNHDDALFGGANNDIMVDGFGRDFMVGGEDDDLFVLTADVPTTGAIASAATWDYSPYLDVVFDFNPEEDLIGLSGYTDATGDPIDFDDLVFEDVTLSYFPGTMVSIPAGPGAPADMLFLNDVESTELDETSFVWM